MVHGFLCTGCKVNYIQEDKDVKAVKEPAIIRRVEKGMCNSIGLIKQQVFCLRIRSRRKAPRGKKSYKSLSSC